MWDAFVDAWAIAAGAVPAPPQPSEELQRAVSILLGLPEADLMTHIQRNGQPLPIDSLRQLVRAELSPR